MHPFLEMISITGAIALAVVGAVIALSLFFRLMSWSEKSEAIAIHGVMKRNTWVTVHMQSGEKFEQVRFVGFTNADNLKTRIPYDLSGMAILEDEKKTQFLVRAKAIRMIVIDPPQETLKAQNSVLQEG